MSGFTLADIVAVLYEVDEDLDVLRCIRCQEVVTWVTRHAAERHGDDVEVMPPLYAPCGLTLW